ncbi:MAG: PKD domain-containing protein [Saprospiraceae bacterium]|nr:PKD domain-containing protein [Saprospiraceae bacterium]
MPAPNFSSIPSYPHFRLGPVDESICDSLGIDNIPLARWRYEANAAELQTIHFFDLSNYDPSEWSWDFGDQASGSNIYSNLSNPVHRFSSPGVYRICLTVRNANGSGTQCKEVNILFTSNEQDLPKLKPSIQWQYYTQSHTLSIDAINLLTPVSIAIGNAHGHTLIHKHVKNLPAEISLVDFPPGVYWIKVIDSEKHLLFNKIIIP